MTTQRPQAVTAAPRKSCGRQLAWLVLIVFIGAVEPALADRTFKAEGCRHAIRKGETQAQVSENCGPPDSTYVHSQIERTGKRIVEGVYYPAIGNLRDQGTVIIGPFYRRADPKIVNYDFWVYELRANCKNCSPWELKVVFHKGRVINARKVKADRP